MSQVLSEQRKSIFPEAEDDWASIAARELPGVPTEEAVADLQSWNLHVFMRRITGKDSFKPHSQILPSDVIFVEPPRAAS